MIKYADIAGVARLLRRDGLGQLADELCAAHEGIFNGLELAMAWRFHLARVLAAELHADTRARAQALWEDLDETLA